MVRAHPELRFPGVPTPSQAKNCRMVLALVPMTHSMTIFHSRPCRRRVDAIPVALRLNQVIITLSQLEEFIMHKLRQSVRFPILWVLVTPFFISAVRAQSSTVDFKAKRTSGAPLFKQ
jgi:hypothetical protein